MLESIQKFANFLDVDPFWMYLVLALLFVLGIVKCIYPWRPKWKSKTTKDKDGNTETTYYHLDI